MRLASNPGSAENFPLGSFGSPAEPRPSESGSAPNLFAALLQVLLPADPPPSPKQDEATTLSHDLSSAFGAEVPVVRGAPNREKWSQALPDGRGPETVAQVAPAAGPLPVAAPRAPLSGLLKNGHAVPRREPESRTKESSAPVAMPAVTPIDPTPDPAPSQPPESHAKASGPPNGIAEAPAEAPAETPAVKISRSAELAFAAKVTPKVPTPTEEKAPAATRPVPHEQPQRIVQEVPPAPPQAAVYPSGEPRRTESQAEIHEPARVPEPLPEPVPAKASEAMRDISLRLTDASKEHVEVRLSERSGELRVSVHSGDAHLNAELRNSLGDLAGKLEKRGFETETWRPSPDTPQQGRQGQGRQPREETQQFRNRRNNRPKWVEEIGDRSK